jgi:cytochrome c oxidase cbb3-type subunit 3
MRGFEKDKLLENHEADGIREFDNDLPLWWFTGFIFTILFSFSYLVYYHVSYGPSSQAEYEQEVAVWTKQPEGGAAEAKAAPVEPLTDFASIDRGRAIFTGTTNNCFVCHRADLGGQVGPNLTDDYWIHGGDLPSIMKSIRTGYPDKGMLPFGSGARLSDEQVLQVASFILSLKGSNPPNPKPVDLTREKKWIDGQPADVPEKPKEEKATEGKPKENKVATLKK